MDNNQNKKNNKNNPNNNRQGLGIVLITTLLVAFVLIGFFSAMGNTSQREISYDKFLKLVSEHKVKEVKLDSEKIYITLTDKAREEAREKAVEKAEKEGRLSPFEEAMERLRIQLPSVKKEGKEHAPDFYTGYVDDDTLVTKLDRAGVKFQSEIPDTIGQLFFEMFVTVILPLLLMVWLFTYMMKRMNKGGGMMGIGKSNAKMYMEKETGVTFRDVAGEDEAKESLQEVVDFLHNPGKYSGIGAKLPKGALLVGPREQERHFWQRRLRERQKFRFSHYRVLRLWKCMSVSEHPVFVICSNRLSSRLRVLCLSTRSMRSERQEIRRWAEMMRESRL